MLYPRSTRSRPESLVCTSVLSLLLVVAVLERTTTVDAAVVCDAETDPCAPHGVCMPGFGCLCHRSDLNGYWAGETCSECAPGYAGVFCSTQCRGGACTPCNGHGKCSEGADGDGSCQCVKDQLNGFWAGVACDHCTSNNYGFWCNNTCPGEKETCNGHGTCDDDVTGTGTCQCDGGWSRELQCSACDGSHFGSTCALQCTGYQELTNVACSSHGRCFSGTQGNGSCLCDDNWGSFDCSRSCPNFCSPPNGECIDGADSPATCRCKPNFAVPDCATCIFNKTGPSCALDCPDFNGKVCGLHGNCTYSADTGTASCSCSDGFYGDSCEFACPGDPPCSGHGQCLSGACQCTTSAIDGRWGSADCSTCAAGYSGNECLRACPIGGNGLPCSGNGVCVNGDCFCSRFVVGPGVDYCGPACEMSSIPELRDPKTGEYALCATVYCATQYHYGSGCNSVCRGFVSGGLHSTDIVCSGHGHCREGRLQDGTCACEVGYVGDDCALGCPGGGCSGNARGYCTMSNKTDGSGGSFAHCHCRERYAGTNCELICPVVADVICSGHGRCNNTDLGNGMCLCDDGWTGESCNVPCYCNKTGHGRCDAVKCFNNLPSVPCETCICDGNFDALCDRCKPGFQGLKCDGLCVNGTTSGQSCVCQTNFSTRACDIKCPSSADDGFVCGGHGECHWGPLKTGVCACDETWFSPACEVFCTTEYCSRTTALQNTQCNPQTGQCECQDDEFGHWDGDTCQACLGGYMGMECATPCPCNDRGTCDAITGECFCYRDDNKGHFDGLSCDHCLSGFIGAGCTQPNIAVSRVETVLQAPTQLQLSAEIADIPGAVGPLPSVLLVDNTHRFLYAGAIPILKLKMLPNMINETLATSYLQVRQAETFGCSKDIGEAISAFTSGGRVFFLLQPSALCRRSVRLISADRSDSVNAFFTTVLYGDRKWANNNVSLRVSEACDDGSGPNPDADTTVAVALMRQFQGPGGTGGAFPGGLLLRIDVTFVTTGNEDSADKLLVLNDTFIPATVAALYDKVLVGGTERDGLWDLHLYKANGIDGFAPFHSQTLLFPNSRPSAPASIVPLLPCMPSLGSRTFGDPTVRCPNCISVMKATFFYDAPLVVIASREELFLTWIEKLEPNNVVLNETIVASVRQECQSLTVIQGLTGPGSKQLRDPKSGAMHAFSNVDIHQAYFARLARAQILGDPTAMAIDYATNITYIALALPGTRTSSGLPQTALLKYLVDRSSFRALGIKELGTGTKSEVIHSLAVDPANRVMYGILSGSSAMRLVTFLLYEALAVDPSIVDQRAGSTLRVTGRGFSIVRNYTTLLKTYFPVRCRFGDTFTDAVDVTPTEVVCPAAAASSDIADSCSSDVVQVTMYGDKWFTENTASTIQRVQQVRITSIYPNNGSIAGNTRITLTGQGFVDSPYAKCRFFSHTAATDTTIEYGQSLAFEYRNPNEAVCVQPATSAASVDPSFLDVSLDGQLYSGETRPYDIIGNGYTVRTQHKDQPVVSVTSKPIIMTAQPVVTFAVGVLVVDEQGHPLLGHDEATPRQVVLGGAATLNDPATQQRLIDANFTLSLVNDPTCRKVDYPWFGNQTAGKYPDDPCRANLVNVTSGNWSRETASGVVFFTDLVLINPRATVEDFVIKFTVPSEMWETEMMVRIVPGEPHAILMSNYEWYLGRGGTPVPHRFERDRSISPEPEIIVVDVLGNQVHALTDVVVRGHPFYRMDSDNSVHHSLTTYTASGDGNGVVFTEIRLPFLHGASHYVNFTADVEDYPNLHSTLTPPFRTQLCPVEDLQYKVPETSSCKSCPLANGQSAATCNGTERIIARPTFWRANINMSHLYYCDTNPINCLGEPMENTSNVCKVGYEGPLCSVCSAGYGRSVGKTCAACNSYNESVRDVVLITIGFVLALLLWTIATLRDAEITDITIVLRTVVNHMQATGNMGEFSARWDPFLKSVFKTQGSGSSLSFSGIASLDCILKANGHGYQTIFFFYMTLPLLSIVLTALVYAVMKGAKLAPAITAKLKTQIEDEVKVRPQSSLKVILHTYPFSMVFVPTTSIFMFSVYQTLITESTLALRCRELVVAGNDMAATLFMQADMSIKCTADGDHSFRFIAIIAAIGYGFGVPVVFVLSYWFINSRTGKADLTNTMFLFLVGGYKPQYWFWQAIIMVRKMLLVTVIVFIEDNRELQSYGGVWVMTLALVLQIYYSPNVKDEHNVVEAMSLAVLTLTLNLGLLYFWEGMNELGENILTATLVVITFATAVLFLYFILKPLRSMLLEGITEARAAMAEMKNKKDNQGPALKLSHLQRDDEDMDDDESDEEGADFAAAAELGRMPQQFRGVTAGAGGSAGSPGRGRGGRGQAHLFLPQSRNTLSRTHFSFHEVSDDDLGVEDDEGEIEVRVAEDGTVVRRAVATAGRGGSQMAWSPYIGRGGGGFDDSASDRGGGSDRDRQSPIHGSGGGRGTTTRRKLRFLKNNSSCSMQGDEDNY